MSVHLNQVSLNDTKTFSKEPNPVVLPLKNQQNLQIELNDFESWLATLELRHQQKQTSKPTTSHQKEHSSQELAMEMVSRFGFKNPNDLIQFLKSPAGESTRAIIMEALNEKQHLEEEMLKARQEQELMRKRLLAFIFLAFLHRKEAKAHLLTELILEQIDHVLHHDAKHDKEEPTQPVSHLEKMLMIHDQDIHLLNQTIAVEQSHLNRLQSEHLTIQQQAIQIQQKYDTFTNYLDEIHRFIDLHQTNEDKGIEDIDHDAIHERINTLSEHIERDSYEVAELIESGQEHLARQKLEISNAQNLQIAVLKDMLAVVKGERLLCRLDGTTARSFVEADLILPREKKIVQSNDKHYLIAHNQRLEDLSVEQQHNAHKAFLRMKPDMMTVNQLIKQNQSREEKAHAHKASHLVELQQTIQKDIQQLHNQIRKIQAVRSEIVNEIAQNQASKHPSESALPNHLQPVNCTPTISNALPLNSKASASNVMNKSLKPSPSPKKEAKPSQPLNVQIAQGLFTPKPGEPIPQEIMKNLLANARQMQNTANALHDNRAKHATPTPFSTRLKCTPMG